MDLNLLAPLGIPGLWMISVGLVWFGHRKKYIITKEDAASRFIRAIRFASF